MAKIKRAAWTVMLALAAAPALAQVPAAGDLTSANQKYGGPPCRSRDLAATPPSGPISDSPPAIFMPPRMKGMAEGSFSRHSTCQREAP